MLRLLCWTAHSLALPLGRSPRGRRLLCCRKLELVSRPVESFRARPRRGLGLPRLVWTQHGSWQSPAPGEGVAVGPLLSAWPMGAHRSCPLPRPTPRLFRCLRRSKESRDSHALGQDLAVSAQVGQMGPGRDRVPGRSEPALQGPVSALCTEGQHVGVLSVGGDMVWLGAWLHGAGTGPGQRRGGQRAAGREERGDRLSSAVEVEA